MAFCPLHFHTELEIREAHAIPVYENGEHVGYGVAVYHRGEKVVDLWGGLADEAEGKPWSENTMAVSYSVTKGVDPRQCAARAWARAAAIARGQ